MNSKFCVSLEAARLLKEKGYDRECIAYYQHGTFYPYAINTQRELSITNKNAAPAYMEQYSAPIKAEAFDWLESKGNILEVLQDYRGQWFYVIKEVCVSEEDDTYFPTRLEAEDAAIIKALEML